MYFLCRVQTCFLIRTVCFTKNPTDGFFNNSTIGPWHFCTLSLDKRLHFLTPNHTLISAFRVLYSSVKLCTQELIQRSGSHMLYTSWYLLHVTPNFQCYRMWRSQKKNLITLSDDWMMRLNPRFYFNTSLKKGLIKIWGDLAKKKNKTKQNKTKPPCSRRKSVLMIGVAMGKCQKYIFVH